MAEIKQTERASRLFNEALECCKNYRHEFLMPEHLLLVLIDDFNFNSALNIFYNPQELAERVEDFLDGIDTMPEGMEYEPVVSAQMGEVIETAVQHVAMSSAESLDLPHLVSGILALKDSWAAYLLKDALGQKESNFMSQLISICEFDDQLDDMKEEQEKSSGAQWKKLVTCMNDHYQRQNPLIGREQELKRTIQVLCRRDKNNPLHVGEPGVGKTALVWGLVRLIEHDQVPQRLKGSRIYQLDMGTLLAGTQYRGDFENRIKQIMDVVQNESDNNIVYIDEIHTLVGAGATGEGAMDASNMLKPYLESGRIRFIGSTTYEEYNRHFSRSKGLIRRFQQIDITEPSVEETKIILRQLLPRYEEFHGVKYEDEAITFAVEASAKHINDRFLPDKAIDLIDEAGAAMEIASQIQTIGKKEIADVLSKTCKVDALSVAEEDDLSKLYTLNAKLSSQIYGQDEAIRQVVESVQMSRAGLLEENKPLASLLFVGPTGVGKTEVARVLSKELGIELIRF
ncbi:MAG: AAA family ATPase, partial [Bacteroidaceae bacterium]|nr:AAA family ATPase [Bacteroidaceae bacterium]